MPAEVNDTSVVAPQSSDGLFYVQQLSAMKETDVLTLRVDYEHIIQFSLILKEAISSHFFRSVIFAVI